MRIPGLKNCGHDYHGHEILTAIVLAGAYIAAANPYHRRHDIPKNKDRRHLSHSGFAWVIPNDIGYSSTGDTRLLERLKKLTKKGLLEMRYHGDMPRFRVVRKHLVKL